MYLSALIYAVGTTNSIFLIIRVKDEYIGPNEAVIGPA